MRRYIDANDFENAMYHEAFETDTEMQRWDSGCWIRYKLFENILEKQPTADVVPVVHGKWIKDEDASMETLEAIYVCSACHNFEAWGETEKHNYCPNCGARMDGEA